MAKYYIVAKEPDSDNYDLIKVNNGDSLEEIDIYTSNFKDKEAFMEYLQGQGLHASSNADLFIAYQNREKNIEHLDLVYGYYKLKDFAQKSLTASPNANECIKETIKEVKNNEDFKELIRKDYFKIYATLKNIILNSYRRAAVKYAVNEQWVRSDYRSGRDALAIIDEYYLIKDRLKKEGREKLQEEKLKKDQIRSEIDWVVNMKMEAGPDQITLVGEQRSYVNLLYINGKMFGNKDTKKVVKKPKKGKISNKAPLSIPTFEDIEIDYSKHQEIGDLLRKLNFKVLKTKKGERFEVDFSKEKFSLNETDIDYLNGLLKASLRKNSFLRQFYGRQKSEGAKRESRGRSSSVYNTIKNCAKKKDKFYDKAYRFYMIYNYLIKDKQITLDDVLILNEEEPNAKVPRR